MVEIWTLVKNFGLLVLWFVTTYWMFQLNLADTFNPSLAGTTAIYGHSGPDDLKNMIILSAIELVVLYLILRPWSYQRSWSRSFMALLLFAPWTVLSMIVSMHTGSILTLHWLWLLVLDIVLLASIVGSLAESIIPSRYNGGERFS